MISWHKEYENFIFYALSFVSQSFYTVLFRSAKVIYRSRLNFLFLKRDNKEKSDKCKLKTIKSKKSQLKPTHRKKSFKPFILKIKWKISENKFNTSSSKYFSLFIFLIYLIQFQTVYFPS